MNTLSYRHTHWYIRTITDRQTHIHWYIHTLTVQHTQTQSLSVGLFGSDLVRMRAHRSRGRGCRITPKRGRSEADARRTAILERWFKKPEFLPFTEQEVMDLITTEEAWSPLRELHGMKYFYLHFTRKGKPHTLEVSKSKLAGCYFGNTVDTI